MKTEIKWGPNGEDVFLRTYSRTKSNGEKESWPETVERVVDGNMRLVYGPGYDNDQNRAHETLELIDHIQRFAIIPAGRHLWASGVKGRQYLQNCFVSGWTDKVSEHFTFTFLRLMEGGGVGANYSSKNTEKYGPPRQAIQVHIVCDDDHQDYEAMRAAGLLSDCFSSDYQGAYFEVEDSREGWADALKDLLEAAWAEEASMVRVYDVSRVRPAGSRLKTFGGSASGPGPLAKMLRDIADVIRTIAPCPETNSPGWPMDPISAMEIDHAIAQCVVAGGNRRSARMAMLPWDDPWIFEFIKCKRESESHWTTNISVAVDDRFFECLNSDDQGPDENHATLVMMAVTEGMLTNGEPGFFNVSKANEGEVGRVECTNPCITSDTWILTSEGAKKVSDLIGKKFTAIVDGKPYSSTEEGFFKTGHKEVFKVVTDEGWEVRVTWDHELYRPDGSRVKVSELKPGDKLLLTDNYGIVPWDGHGTEDEGYVLGWLVGDGTFNPDGKAILSSQGKPETQKSRDLMFEVVDGLPHRSDFSGWFKAGKQISMTTVGLTNLAESFGVRKGNKVVTEEIERASYDFYIGFLRALFDTDGHVEGSEKAGYSVRLGSVDLDSLKAVQRMLGRLGIKSSIRDLKPERDMVCPHTGNTYQSKKSYRLIISGRGFVRRYAALIGFLHEGKANKLNEVLSKCKKIDYKLRFEATVKEIIPDGVEDVYDCTIEDVFDFDANGLRSRDCGEIPLEEWEPCNLGHINLEAFVKGGAFDFSAAERAVRLMTRFLIRATFGDINDPKTRAIVDRNRRIGVGLFGFQAALAKLGIPYSEAHESNHLRWILGSLRDAARDEARKYAFELRIPEPVKVTTVAPTGTIAKLPGTTEGIHPIYARYFIRRIRFSTVDPDQLAMLDDYERQGYKIEPCMYAENTAVVEIPTKERLVEDVEAMGLPESIVESADEISLGDMLAVQAMIQECWADNAVSFTVNVEPGSYSPEDLAHLLMKWLPKLKGTTIMVDDSRPQAPYQRITKQEYEEYLNYRKVREQISDSIDLECSSGACPIR